LRPSGLVLVHGITPQGKDDPQLRTAAALLARAGWAVSVPTIDGLTALRLRPDDAGAVAGATRALFAQGYRPVAMLGISLGAAPTLSAAGEPELAAALSAVLTLGGYASSRELLRYTLTGAYAFGDARGRRPVDENGIARFARANVDLVERGSRSLVANRDPDKVDHLIDALPEDTRRLLDALSPEVDLPRIRVPLFLMHGRGDLTVPFTESLRLDRRARAAGRPVRTVIVGALGHVEPGTRATVSELVASWAAFYAFRVTATRALK
jgi:dipeptidyl aminopeptidase/acylaminoacyl peptidase